MLLNYIWLLHNFTSAICHKFKQFIFYLLCYAFAKYHIFHLHQFNKNRSQSEIIHISLVTLSLFIFLVFINWLAVFYVTSSTTLYSLYLFTFRDHIFVGIRNSQCGFIFDCKKEDQNTIMVLYKNNIHQARVTKQTWTNNRKV